MAENVGQLIAHERAVEALGRVELIAVAHGLGDAGEHLLERGLGLFLDRGGEEILRERDAAARRARGGEGLEDLVLGRHGFVAHDVAIRLLQRNADAGILDQLLLHDGPPFLELRFADDLVEHVLHFDGARGFVRVGGKGVDHELHRIVLEERLDLGGLGLAAGEDVLGGQDIHAADAELRVHVVALLVLEIDDQLMVGLVVGLDLAETPAAVHDVIAGLHRLEFGFGRLQGGVFGNERGDGFGIHNCVSSK